MFRIADQFYAWLRPCHSWQRAANATTIRPKKSPPPFFDSTFPSFPRVFSLFPKIFHHFPKFPTIFHYFPNIFHHFPSFPNIFHHFPSFPNCDLCVTQMPFTCPIFFFLPAAWITGRESLSRDMPDGSVVRPGKGRMIFAVAALRVAVLGLGFGLGLDATQSTPTFSRQFSKIFCIFQAVSPDSSPFPGLFFGFPR